MKGKEEIKKQRSKILIPTNFSGHALIAGEYAMRLLDGSPCEYILENVHSHSAGHAGTLIKVGDLIEREAGKSLLSEQQKLESVMPAADIEARMEEGDAVTVIERCLKKEHIDLLVVGHNSHVKAFLNSFIESPVNWPALFVPNKRFGKQVKESVLIESPRTRGSQSNFCVEAIEGKVNSDSRKLYYKGGESAATLKKELDSLLKKGTTDLVIFHVPKESDLENAIKGHMFDELILSYPVLLLST